MATREYVRGSRTGEGGSNAAGSVVDSGSWSDVSDNLDYGSYDAFTMRNSYHTDPNDLSDRLFNSLDLGHGSFYVVDSVFDGRSPHSGPASLPDHSMTNGTVPTAPKTRHVKSKSNVTATTSSAADSEQGYGMKTKFLSAWNNVRHGEIKQKFSSCFIFKEINLRNCAVNCLFVRPVSSCFSRKAQASAKETRSGHRRDQIFSAH